MRTRRRFSSEFKAKVALEAIKGHETVAELAIKAQGAKLGNRTNAAEALTLGRQALTAEADAFATNVMPIVETLKATGVTDLRGLAAALNSRGVGPPLVDDRLHLLYPSVLKRS